MELKAQQIKTAEYAGQEDHLLVLAGATHNRAPCEIVDYQDKSTNAAFATVPHYQLPLHSCQGFHIGNGLL